MAGYGSLGQCMASATPTTYTACVTATSQSVLSTLIICNQTDAPQTFYVRHRVNNAPADPKQIFINKGFLPKNETLFMTIGLSLGAGDIIEVAASSAQVSFSASGLSA